MAIPHIRVSIGEPEIDAVTKVLRSGNIAMGAVATELEAKIASQSKQRHAIVVNSGTAALHVALIALGVGKGDEVLVPDYACQALLQAVRYVGADVCLVDIVPETFNIDPAAARAAIRPRTKALIVPHMFGLMADMTSLKTLGLPIIEDCAMSIGAQLAGNQAGSMGDIATFSFHATKPVTGGEGGGVATSDQSWADIARDVREYDKKEEFRTRYNYKMSDINAALALSQLQRIDEGIAERNRLARRYDEGLHGTSFILPQVPEAYVHAFARYVIRTDDGSKVRAHLHKHGIGAGKGVALGLRTFVSGGSDFPASEKALRTAVSLPIYPSLIEAEQDAVIDALRTY